jgi:hypothetical protein
VGQVVHLGNVFPFPITPSGFTALKLDSTAHPYSVDTTDQEATTPNPNPNPADEKTQSTLEAYGPEMWEFLQRMDGRGTTRALNIFKVGGEARE